MTKCVICGKNSNKVWECDKCSGLQWCDYCWKDTECGKGNHDEHCASLVIEGKVK